MVYGDTSVLVASIVNESGSAAVAKWYAGTKAELVCAAWCVPEFASALGIKQRTGQLNEGQACDAWGRFERLVAMDLKLLPVEPHSTRRRCWFWTPPARFERVTLCIWPVLSKPRSKAWPPWMR